jgi:hypothetical protein
MALTVKVTAMGGLVSEEPPVTTMLGGIGSCGEPGGIGGYRECGGVVPLKPKSCPFTFSQG